jgi:hypothetical protein
MGWPPRAVDVSPWNESVQVPDMELYVCSDSAKRTWGAARIAGSRKYLEGKKAFNAARKRVGDSDPMVLATLAMLFLDDNVAGKEPWIEPKPSSERPAEQQAMVEPPKLSGVTLEYWRSHSQLADLVRCRVTLTTGKVECEMARSILRARAMAENPWAVIEEDLESDDIYGRMHGIEQLAAMRTPRAIARLHDLALNQGHFRVREAAVKALATTAGEGTVETLSRVLLFDRHAKVRQAAARALGELRDPAAHDALRRAKDGDADGNVRHEAEYALKHLDS